MAKRSLLKECKACSHYFRATLTDDNRVCISPAEQARSATTRAATRAPELRVTRPSLASGASPRTLGAPDERGLDLSDDDFAAFVAGGRKELPGRSPQTSGTPGSGPSPAASLPLENLAAEASRIAKVLEQALEQIGYLESSIIPQQAKMLAILDRDAAALRQALDAFSDRMLKDVCSLVHGTKALHGITLKCAQIAKWIEALSQTVAKTKEAPNWGPLPPPRVQPPVVAADEESAARLAEQVLSKVLAPEGLRAGLNAYHQWLVEHCNGGERRFGIIERLPGLLRIVEDALTEWRSVDASAPQRPERQGVLAELEKLHKRIRDWVEWARLE